MKTNSNLNTKHSLTKETKQDPRQWRNWYVLHTYSWYEDAVEKALRQRIETMNMQDYIFDVKVPKETEYVIKKWKPVEEKRRIFPGYVLIDMVVTDESWYVARNTPNVTWFVWAGTTPIPVSPEEFWLIVKKTESKQWKFKTDFGIWDVVKITDWPFAWFEGKIWEIDEVKWKVKVLVNVFERETLIELDFAQIKKK